MVVLFAVFRSFTFVFSRMPFPVLYLFSDLLKFILHHVVRYRRQIILKNLSRAFPLKSDKEIRSIMNKYYRNLADLIVEVIKLESIKKSTLGKRFSIEGLEVMLKAFENEKSVLVAIGHCGNWEWMGIALSMLSPIKGYGIIKPLSDKRFHNYMLKLRQRFIPDNTIDFMHTYRNMVKITKAGKSYFLIAGDQTPTRADFNYWSSFLNQDTAFYNGIEKLSKALDFTVVFMDIYRTGRGKYHAKINLITDDPKNTAELEIMESYIHHLERSLTERPDNWLWSHRRWKFEKPVHADH